MGGGGYPNAYATTYISLCSKLAYGGGQKLAISCLRSLWMPPIVNILGPDLAFSLEIQREWSVSNE